MDTKDDLFINALMTYGYVSQPSVDMCIKEVAAKRSSGQHISIENYLVQKKLLTKEQVALIYSKITMSPSDAEEIVRSKTITFDGYANKNMGENNSFTIAPTPPHLINNNPEEKIPTLKSESDSVFLGNAIGQKLGRYEIIDRLGRGGMGIVYKAEDTTLQRIVAIKVLIHSEMELSYSDRFKREAQMAASLNHPNIMSIFDISTIGNNYYLVIEYIEGESLSEKLKRNKIIPVDESVRIIKKVAEALYAACELKIVHRDIKPANIMITKQGEPKVTDFGLAKMPSSASISHSGQVVGTPAYMAPEQVEGKLVDHRSDLYSLGVTFYEMLCGQQPFKGDNLYNIMMSHVHKEPLHLQNYSHIPANVAKIVMKMIAKKPQERFQTGKEISEILEKYLNKNSISITTKPKRRILKVLVFLLLISSAILYSIPKFFPNHPISHKIVVNWQTAKTKTIHLWSKIKETYASTNTNVNAEVSKREVIFHVDYKYHSGEHGHLDKCTISIIHENYKNIAEVSGEHVQLLPGKYIYKIEKKGYENIMESLEVEAGKDPITLIIIMHPLPRKMSFNVVKRDDETIVRAQEIIVNGVKLKENDMIHPGENSIRVTFAEYQDLDTKRNIPADDEEYVLKSRLIPKGTETDNHTETDNDNHSDTETDNHNHSDTETDNHNHSDTETDNHNHSDTEQKQENDIEKLLKNLKKYKFKISQPLKEPISFTVNSQILPNDFVRYQGNDRESIEIFVSPEAKTLYIEHGFYFAEISLTGEQQNIIFKKVNIDKLMSYLKTLDIDEVPSKMFSFYYHQEILFRENSMEDLQKLVSYIKSLNFTETYQKKYRDSIVNQLQITIKEKK